MTHTIHAEFAVKSWDEKTWEGVPSVGLTSARRTHAIVTFGYTGPLEASSTVHYLMSYVGSGEHGTFTALEHIEGTLEGRSGAFDVVHTGTFDSIGVKGTVQVVPGSATGDLAGLRGTGVIDLAGHQERYPFTFEYELAE